MRTVHHRRFLILWTFEYFDHTGSFLVDEGRPSELGGGRPGWRAVGAVGVDLPVNFSPLTERFFFSLLVPRLTVRLVETRSGLARSEHKSPIEIPYGQNTRRPED